MERKALRLALQQRGQSQRWDLQTQNQYLHELRRLYRLQGMRLSHPAFFDYPKIVQGKFNFWTQEQAMEEAWGFLERSGDTELEQTSDIYFLGFHLPEFPLLRGLAALLKRFPQLNIHIFLPPPEKMIDGKGLLTPAVERLEHLAKQKTVYRPLPFPSLVLQTYLTPLHEGFGIIQELQKSNERSCIFTPRLSPSKESLQAWLLNTPSGTRLVHSPAKILDLTPCLILENLEEKEATSSTVRFPELMKKLLPRFQAAREGFSKENNIPALSQLEASFGVLQEWSYTESVYEENRSLDEWIQDLKEEFIEVMTPGVPHASRKIPMRFLDGTGLGEYDRIFINSLNEGIYPSGSVSSLTPDDFGHEFLLTHEAMLNLEQCMYQAKSEAILSYVDYSISGRVASPTSLLNHWDLSPKRQKDPALPVVETSPHPYFEENILREKRRRKGASYNIDQGNLVPLELKTSLLSRVKKRPLSAGYLNDYAKCPWLFFSRWHLGLEQIPEEDLEIEPKLRGSIAHKLLEGIFRSLERDYWIPKKIPSLATLEEHLEKSAEELWQEIPNYPEAEWLPASVIQDEMDRIKNQVLALLREEHQAWVQSEQKMLPKYLEWNFGKGGGPSVGFSIDPDTQVSISGAIDRIDLSEDERHFLVIDYKSSGTEMLAREMRDKMSFQLFLYLYAVQNALLKNHDAVGALYWDLKKTKKNQGLVIKSHYAPFVSGPLKGHSFMEEEDFARLKDSLEVQLREVLQKILQGDYSLNPPQCLGSRCPCHEICRYENQPQ
jgi:RecB family exonuclease